MIDKFYRFENDQVLPKNVSSNVYEVIRTVILTFYFFFTKRFHMHKKHKKQKTPYLQTKIKKGSIFMCLKNIWKGKKLLICLFAFFCFFLLVWHFLVFMYFVSFILFMHIKVNVACFYVVLFCAFYAFLCFFALFCAFCGCKIFL